MRGRAARGMPRTLLASALAMAAAAGGGTTPLPAQAPVSIVSLGVGYNSQKTSARATGELKARLDSLDAQIAIAQRAGRTSELRRLYAKGTAIARNRPWTPESEYAASLFLRTDRQILDPTRPWSARLEQLFAPGITLERTLTARVTVRQRPAGAPLTTPPAVVREIGTLDGVPRDLLDAPFIIDADLKGLPDGSYQFVVEVADSTRTLGTASLGIVLRAGLDAQIARLEAAAQRATPSLRADLLYPVDRVRVVNAGRIELRTFDAPRAFAAADSLIAAVNAKRDPFLTRTGDFTRHYLLPGAGEILPYRLYVPTRYKPGVRLPLIVALHGLGATEDSFFDAYGAVLPKLAEERGYIVVAPLGYRVDGAYGVVLPGADAGPAGARARALSEQDVLEVFARVKAQYTVDESRMFLMGHSMGAIGTWALAMKNPKPWAALGVFSGFGNAASASTISGIPQFVVHGDADPTVPVLGSRTMVKALEAAGGKVTYVEVPGGNHSDVVQPNLPKMFDLFDSVGRRAATSSPAGAGR